MHIFLFYMLAFRNSRVFLAVSRKCFYYKNKIFVASLLAGPGPFQRKLRRLFAAHLCCQYCLMSSHLCCQYCLILLFDMVKLSHVQVCEKSIFVLVNPMQPMHETAEIACTPLEYLVGNGTNKLNSPNPIPKYGPIVIFEFIPPGSNCVSTKLAQFRSNCFGKEPGTLLVRPQC